MTTFPRMKRANWFCAIFLPIVVAVGCRSSSHARRDTPSAMSGPPMGTSLDDIDARNRADIAAQLGRQVAAGPATPEEVVAMSRAGIDTRFIICYVNRSINMPAVSAQDVIYMHDQGVNEQVIQAMLTPGSAYSRAEVARSMPAHIYVLGDPWWPYYFPQYGYFYGCGCYGHRCY
jgi:hypothetical protein